MNKRKILSWFLFLGVITLIFLFSHQTGNESSNLSSNVLMNIEKILHVSLKHDIFSFGLRKLAHFTEYAILGISTLNLISCYLQINKKTIIYSVLFVLCYASLDEIHQLFIPSRCGSIFDVLIDSCGGSFGIISYLLLRNIMHKKA